MTNPVPESEPRPISESGRPHGKLSSWLLVAVVTAAFLCGGIAMITHAWWLFWTCVAVVLLSVPAGRAVRIMDDTMVWRSAIPSNYRGKVITIEATRQQKRRRWSRRERTKSR
jgi:hypothetical protein